MEKKTYIQPEIKSLTVEEDLMAALSGETNGQYAVDVNETESEADGTAKENNWANTPSVWD